MNIFKRIKNSIEMWYERHFGEYEPVREFDFQKAQEFYEANRSVLMEYQTLIVVKSISKSYGVPGIRLGVALGNKELISKLYDVKNSFNSYPVDRLAQVIGKASVEDSDYIKENALKIINTRERVSQELKKLGFEMTSSYSNFIFVRHPEIEGEYIFRQLRNKGIVVRWFNQPRINQYLRITIGTDEQMNRLIEETKEIVAGVE